MEPLSEFNINASIIKSFQVLTKRKKIDDQNIKRNIIYNVLYIEYLNEKMKLNIRLCKILYQ
jgi:hypothetical protein